MAFRRQRIKAVANVPVRRKGLTEEKDTEPKIKEMKTELQPEVNNEKVEEKEGTARQSENVSSLSKESDTLSDDNKSTTLGTENKLMNSALPESSRESSSACAESNVANSNSEPIERCEISLPLRKRFKASVSLSSATRKPRNVQTDQAELSKIGQEKSDDGAETSVSSRTSDKEDNISGEGSSFSKCNGNDPPLFSSTSLGNMSPLKNNNILSLSKSDEDLVLNLNSNSKESSKDCGRESVINYAAKEISTENTCRVSAETGTVKSPSCYFNRKSSERYNNNNGESASHTTPVGVPVASQCIPTGTTIRHHGFLPSSTYTLSSGCEVNNDIQLIPEADIPVEGATISDCGVARVPPPPVNVSLKPRFVRPAPKIPSTFSRPRKSNRPADGSQDKSVSEADGLVLSSPETNHLEDSQKEKRTADSENNGESDISEDTCSVSEENERPSEDAGKAQDLIREVKNRCNKVKQKPEKKPKTTERMKFPSKSLLKEKTKLGIFQRVFADGAKDVLSTIPTIQTQNEVAQNNPEETYAEEESVDDSLLNDGVDTEQEQDEDSALVPQLKIGPDGQLIVDTESLVVETTAAKKSKEMLRKSNVIVDTGSSKYLAFSKRRFKTREWSVTDTIKFYEALRTVGTDFSMMAPIFQDRTRAELKCKFKREERVNSDLVTQVLLKPKEFDIEMCKKECDNYDAEEEEKKKKLQIKEPKIKKKRVRRNIKKQKSSYGMHFFEEIHDDGQMPDIPNENSLNKVLSKYETNKLRKRKRRKKNILADWDFSDSENEKGDILLYSDCSSDEWTEDMNKKRKKEGVKSLRVSVLNSESESDSDDLGRELSYLNKPLSQTRFGRIPKRTLCNENEDENNSLQVKQKQRKVATTNKICSDDTEEASKSEGEKDSSTNSDKSQPLGPNLPNLQPGSLVVLAAQSPDDPGHQTYKFFLVTPPDSSSSSSPAVNKANENNSCFETIVASKETVSTKEVQ